MAQTAAQIVATACSIAQAPGYLVQGGQALNEVLSDVCQTYDFDVARGTYNFQFDVTLVSSLPSFPTVIAGGGPYPLPADYLRADYGDVYYVDPANGFVPHRLISLDLYQFDSLVQQAGLQSYPTMYATDLSLEYSAVPVMVVYSPPQSNYPVTLRYRRQMPDIVTPEASGIVPWFPSTQYLIEATAAKVMRITNDDRDAAYDRMRIATMNRILKLANDNSGRAKTVKLDPRNFGPGAGAFLPPTKNLWI